VAVCPSSSVTVTVTVTVCGAVAEANSLLITGPDPPQDQE